VDARPQVILLPGAVLPADLAYGALLEALGDEVEAVAKELELYAGEEPPPDYALDVEIEGILRVAEAAGFNRFHLVGYSGGGASSLAFAAKQPERLRSLALLEPAWAGNEGLDPAEEAAWREFDRIMALPPQQMMPAFVRSNLRPGVEPPPPPPGAPPPWMAKRPAGLKAFTRAFGASELDLDALRRLQAPVYFALGGLSNPDHYAKIAERLAAVFGDFTLELFEQRHHFDPPHRVEAERLAASLRALWARAETISVAG
jgi:pimeloyl-ACP methyl ester carboxylesterase